MRKMLWFSAAAVLVLTPIVIGACAPALQFSIEHDGLTRTYRVHVPDSYDGSTAVPLLLALHGGNGDALKAQRGYKIDPIADREGFIVCYPDGVNNSWNDGRGDFLGSTADDVGFLNALLDQIVADFNVDTDRIYMMGVSNGGMMTYTFACAEADRIAAAAPVISSLPEPLDGPCVPSEPVPLVMMNGTDDPLVPYDGGAVMVFNQERGYVVSTLDTAAYWAAANGCDATPVEVALPNVDPSDGTTIRTFEYVNCTGGATVLLYSVEGGGHTWPRGPQYRAEWFIGRVSNDIDGMESIWTFLYQFSK